MSGRIRTTERDGLRVRADLPYESMVPVASRHGSRALIGIALAVALVALTAGGRAEALDERPLDEALVVGPHECLTAARLGPELARQLGRQTLDRRVGIDIAAEAAGVKVTILYDGAARGIRHIKHEPLCSDYVGVVAISVAMALDALVPRAPRAPEDAAADVSDAEMPAALDAAAEVHVPPPPPRPAPLVDAGPAPRPTPQRLRPSIRALVETTSNLLPSQTWSFATAFDLRAAPLDLRWRLGSGIVFPSDDVVGTSDVTTSAVFARTGGCLSPLPSELRPLRLCAGALAGTVLARGRAAGLARTSLLPLVHGQLGLELAVPLDRGFGLVLGVDGLIGLVRPELVVAAPNGKVLARRRPDVLGVLVGLGIEWND